MKRFQLFSELNDATLWGDTLTDAIQRAKILHVPAVITRIDDNHGAHNIRQPQPPLIVKTVLGIRNTANETRGSWHIISAVVELEDGSIIEVDAREIGELV